MSSKTKTATPASSSAHIKSIAITAICLVLVFVFTALVNIRLPFAPNGGLQKDAKIAGFSRKKGAQNGGDAAIICAARCVRPPGGGGE